MANQLLTRQEITREHLMILENNLKIIPALYRDYDKEFGKKGAKIGDTVYARKPPRFIGRDGQMYQPEGLTDTQAPVVINQQSGVDFQFSSMEKYLSLDEFKDRYLEPAAISLANKLDFRAAQTAMLNTPNHVGTPGTVPGLSGSDAFLIYGNAGRKLDEMGFPLDGNRTMIITPAMRVGWVDFAKAFFNPTTAIAEQYREGQVSNALGYKWFVDQNVNAQTIGALGGTPRIDGANQTGSTINTKGWTVSITNVLLSGDIISFDGVFAVNPQSRQSTGSLQQFVVQADTSSDSGGLAVVTIFPALVNSGQFQNVSATPADSALISVYDTAAAGQGALAGLNTPQALLLHKQSFCFASVPLDVPDGVDMGYEEHAGTTGISVRFVRQYAGATDQWINRFDVAYGIAPLYPEGACRVSS